MDMTVEEIREKGKKLDLSYVQALSLYLFESILEGVSYSELKDKMWLRQTDFFQKGKKKKTVSNQIVYYMKDISYQTLQRAMGEILRQKKDSSFQMEWEMLFLDKEIEIVLHTKIEQVEVPFKVVIRPVWVEDQFSEKEDYFSLLWENKTIEYRAYPMELRLAECFYEILDKLELIANMECYDTVCQILKGRPVDGRRTYLNMVELLEKQPVISVEKRWDTVLGYQDYSYMKKRWNTWRKAEKENLISWEECMETLREFFSPIWNAIQEDRIFIGDWMPHLGRYLE